MLNEDWVAGKYAQQLAGEQGKGGKIKALTEQDDRVRILETQLRHLKRENEIFHISQIAMGISAVILAVLAFMAGYLSARF